MRLQIVFISLFILLSSAGFAVPLENDYVRFSRHADFDQEWLDGPYGRSYHDLTYTRVPRTALPLLNIFDPETHKNEDITKYSFEELHMLLGTQQFRRWNDEEKVCESMLIMFGRSSSHCAAQSLAGLTPGTARAYVSFVVVAPPTPVYGSGKVMVLTDPVTPPWAPTYQPYHPYDPYW